MPYKKEERKEKQKEYYIKNKDKWEVQRKNNLKKYNEDPEFREKRLEITKKSYYKNHEENKKRRREDRLKRGLEIRCKAYGITVDDYYNFPQECNICGKKVKKLYIDHCHKTNIVRGLLCRTCNLMLGMAMDSPEILMNGAKYVKRIKG